MKIREPDGPSPPVALAPEGVALPPIGAPATPGAVAPATKPARAEVEQAVERANRHIASLAPSLEFEIDPQTHDVVVRLVDRVDQQVLRQVPSPEMLAIARALERMQTLLVRARA